MADTNIEWCDKVWNPVTGCTKVSQGCKNCYAETIAGRFWAKQYPPNTDGTPRKFTDVRCHPERLSQPLTWNKPAQVFVNSMSDLFHKDVPDEFIDKVFSEMNIARLHTFIVLTKRPERMLEYLGSVHLVSGYNWRPGSKFAWSDWPLPNVWLGVSVENQRAADERVPLLLQTPAVVRFVSVEPMLEEVDLSYYLNGCPEVKGFPEYSYQDDVEWVQTAPPLQWVICGAESGPGARPFSPDWARSLRDQCQAANVPFFLKQMPISGKLAKMPELDGKVWAEFPKG